MFKALSDTVLVAARQLYPNDIAVVAAKGVTVVVNNRPDGEEPGQPAGADIERAATAAGLRYHHIPVAGGIGSDQIDAMTRAMNEGKTLAFCRSGTRSTYLWALAAHRAGMDGAAIFAAAAAAGYDLSSLRLHLG